ncbi:hypothetical protein N4G65_46395, partial [Streptomyces fulvoviolaceus]|nr:hypothetical protein [Streptomyces fulvoviolaceus]
MRQLRSLRPLRLPRPPGSQWSRLLGALAVAMVCAASVPAPAVAASPSPASPSPTSSAGGDSTSLPSIPLALADDAPCTAASDRTARYATWAQQSLSLSHAWQLSRGEGVTVAVVDTGVSAEAPALSGRVTAVGDAGEDCVGHGTFTAG